MSLKEKDLSTLEIMYSKGTDIKDNSFNAGLTKRKNTKQEKTKPIYKTNFEINSFIKERVYTNMTLPAILDVIGNSFVKIGIGIASIIASIGYLIEKLRG